VTIKLGIVVSPGSPVVGPNGTVQFSATAAGTTVPVGWSAVSGKVTAGGLYTAPASGTDTVTATSVSDSTNKKSASVMIDATSTSTLSSLGPIVAPQKGPGFTLTVNGSGFSNGNTVLFNGNSETTTFVNSTQLTASVSTADIALPGVNAPIPALQVTVQTGSTVTAPTSFYVVPEISAQKLAVSGGGSVGSVNVNLSPITPTLSLQFVGICSNGSCSASQAGTQVSLSQAIADGGRVQMYLVGPGLVPGAFFRFTADSGDITVTQPLTFDPACPLGGDCSDFIPGNPPSVVFNITVSGSTALGPRSILVMNPGGGIWLYPGALLITP